MDISRLSGFYPIIYKIIDKKNCSVNVSSNIDTQEIEINIIEKEKVTVFLNTNIESLENNLNDFLIGE